jgi:adenylosuccinate synthase
MPATIIMGGQWGDEGKGKLTDALAAKAHLVVRANGGSNAGHTIDTPAGVFKLHLVPAGILYPECMCVIGAGVVLDPTVLIEEMDGLSARGVSLDRLVIADRAHVVLPFHPLLDQLEEQRRASGEIGTTRRGIGPTYADKVARRGLRVADLVDPDSLRGKLFSMIEDQNRILRGVYQHEPLDAESVYRGLVAAGERLRPHVVPGEVVVQNALDAGQQVLVVCAQGAMLDVDYGTYPFVTSSSPTAAGACQGAGVAPNQVSRVVAVYKAYGTRVGAGPLPTELHDADGQTIRERGREYGTTTGRPRRTGWFDAVAGRSIVRLNGVTEIALTLLDVLDTFETVRVCTAYRRDGEAVTHIPARAEEMAELAPVYTDLPGWQQDITQVRRPDQLPDEARGYVAFLERVLGSRITMIGVGPAREQLVPTTPDAAILVEGGRVAASVA